MKLIIDISEEDYKNIFSYVQVYKSHYADMIRNGIPITDDCISRSALRTDFVDRYRKAEDWIVKAKDIFIKTRAEATRDFIGEVIMTIDKAPTIGGTKCS